MNIINAFDSRPLYTAVASLYRKIADKYKVGDHNGTVVMAFENTSFNESFFTSTIDNMARGYERKACRLRILGSELGLTGAQMKMTVSVVYFV